MYQDLRTSNGWPVKKAIVDLPIKMKRNSKCTSGNSSSPGRICSFGLFGISPNTPKMKYLRHFKGVN